jgi:putative glycosyltransferase (TIGR04372 family)
MIIKKTFKFLIYILLNFFINKKNKFYLHDFRFLGHLINFMYIKSLNNKLNKIIFIPNQLSKKKNIYTNYKIFFNAYETIYGKKISYLQNFIYYIFFRCLSDLQKQKIRIKFEWKPSQIKKLATIRKSFFEPKITKNHEDKFEKIFQSKYILFTNRDNAFKKKMHPLKDFSYHYYRNEKLSTYVDAIDRYNCYYNKDLFVRFGSVIEKNTNNKNIFNYPKSIFRCENNDLLLMKNCHFYVGTGSGPDILALNYQKPIVYINWHHIPNLYCFRGNIIVIFKKIFDLSRNKFLTFSNLIDPCFKNSCSDLPIGLYNQSLQYKKANLKIVNNTSDEIFHAMMEMDLLLKRKFNFNLNNQNLFRTKFYKYTGKKIPNTFFISEYFMKKNKRLFL